MSSLLCFRVMFIDDRAIIKVARGSQQRATAPIALMAASEADLSRILQRGHAVKGSGRKLANSRILEVTFDSRLITVAGPVLGAPQAAMVLENLIALGSRAIVVLGWCGSLRESVRIGDWFLPTAALSEEGTSLHYPCADHKFEPDHYLTAKLLDFCAHKGSRLHTGQVWTTDAFYRETARKVTTYGAAGAIAVEMEMSALMRIARYRGIRLTGLLVVSDELFTLKWRPGFDLPSFKRSCGLAVKTVLEFSANLYDQLHLTD
ncbi:MAG: nucleoside phosphorylase [Deltaproteobacteria bacterium]|nr:nucleoside phosphorylase [Deltaproteobacteria bacterium]